MSAYGFLTHQSLLSQEQHFLKIASTSVDVLNGDLTDFLGGNSNLDLVAQERVDRLSDEELAGIVLMPAYEKQHTHLDLEKWINMYHIGGFMILNPGYSAQDYEFVKSTYKKDIPLLVSIDAEPSLVKYRLPGLKKIDSTNTLTSVGKSAEAASRISKYIKKLGVNINFAPVYDNNQNTSVIGDRSYGNSAHMIHVLASAFSRRSMEEGIAPTVKHFPGHGNVSGDTHKNLQTITGELAELEQFQQAIDDGAPIVMVGHLAITDNQKWETNGLPASISPHIMTDLLQEELGFKGLIVTDALNMGALDQFDDVVLRALDAGADIVLLPKDIDQAFIDIYNRMQIDPVFKVLIKEKAEKIIRLSLVLRRMSTK